MTALDQRLRHRNAGQDVTRRTTADHEGERGGIGGRPTRHQRSWRAMFSRIPDAAMVNTREDPPADTNGNGTPVIGRAPTLRRC